STGPRDSIAAPSPPKIIPSPSATPAIHALDATSPGSAGVVSSVTLENQPGPASMRAAGVASTASAPAARRSAAARGEGFEVVAMIARPGLRYRRTLSMDASLMTSPQAAGAAAVVAEMPASTGAFVREDTFATTSDPAPASRSTTTIAAQSAVTGTTSAASRADTRTATGAPACRRLRATACAAAAPTGPTSTSPAPSAGIAPATSAARPGPLETPTREPHGTPAITPRAAVGGSVWPKPAISARPPGRREREPRNRIAVRRDPSTPRTAAIGFRSGWYVQSGTRPFWRGIRDLATREAGAHPLAVPMQVARQPVPELEAARPGGAVAPRRRDLGDTHPEPISLHRQLDPELEPARRFDRDLVEQPLRIQPEVRRRVVNREAAQPVQREPGDTRHRALQQRAAELAAAVHVARPRDHVGARPRERVHRVDVLRIVGTVTHRHEHVRCSGRDQPGLDRVQHAAAERVFVQPELRHLGLEALDHRHGRVLVHVVDDENLERPGVRVLDDSAQRRLGVLSLVVDGHDDRQSGRRRRGVQIRPAPISSLIHGMTSSSIVSRLVVASKPSTSRALRTSGTRICTSCS